MTDIPGTGKVDNNPKPDNPDNLVKNISVLNINELKKDKSEITDEDTPWASKKSAWILFGFGIGLIFILLGLFNKRFFILSVLGPIAAYVSWYVKAFVEKIEKKSIKKK